jgi:signal transduction histidine kinase
MRTRQRRPVEGIQLSLWRAVAAFRAVTLLLAVFLIGRWQPIYAHGWVALLVGVAMTAITVAVVWLALNGHAHRPSLVGADLVVTAGLTLLTIAAQTPAQRHGGMLTLTTIWAAGPTLEVAFVAGPIGGVAAGLIQFAASAVVAQTAADRTLYSGMLLVVAGAIVGLVATYTARAEAELRIATAAQAAVAERERLARSIHDGVLQVLGLVHRTGRDVGAPWAELAQAAGEQEAALRGLITSQPAALLAPGWRDLDEDLRGLRSPAVTVSTPGEPIPVEAAIGGELTDAVRAALQNVDQHAGTGAHAWVLLEMLGDEVRVTVRDDGIGMAPGRLDVAAAEGRIGVARSVRGRIDDLGGKCTITSAPGEGTEIEMVVPLRAGDGR